MKKRTLKNIVTKQVLKASFKYLLSKIKSKGKEINYGKELKCQKYLKSNSIFTFEQQISICLYRSRMNKLQYNCPGNKGTETCPCGIELFNQHLYECQTLNSSEKKVNYNNIFDGRLIEMQYVVKMLEDNLKKFELTQAQNLSSWRH